MVLVVIYDKLGDTYSSPITTNNEDTAIRTFKNMLVKDIDNKDDYELYKIADYDDKNAVLTNYEKKLIIKGASID